MFNLRLRLLALLVVTVAVAGCTVDGVDTAWIVTDHGEVTARSRLTTDGVIAELRMTASEELVSTLTVEGDRATLRLADGTIAAEIVAGELAAIPPAGESSTTVFEQTATVLPEDELTANDWVFLLTGAVVEPEADDPYQAGKCEVGETCATCCAGGCGSLCCTYCNGKRIACGPTQCA